MVAWDRLQLGGATRHYHLTRFYHNHPIGPVDHRGAMADQNRGFAPPMIEQRRQHRRLTGGVQGSGGFI
jgi:hypothetical protein